MLRLEIYIIVVINPEGIVWKKKDGLQKGCMLSCLQYEDRWSGSPESCTWITDTYGNNSGWTYPTIDQLDDCFTALVNAGWNEINAKLTALGYEEIPYILLSRTFNAETNRLYLIEYQNQQVQRIDRSTEGVSALYPIRAIKEF